MRYFTTHKWPFTSRTPRPDAEDLVDVTAQEVAARDRFDVSAELPAADLDRP